MHGEIPQLTIIVPTRDRPAMLDRALRSVRAQTRPDWQVIVVDDASSEPASVVSGTDDPRFQVLRNTVSIGVSASRNRGLTVAAAPWTTFLDDDDELRSDFVARVLAALDRWDDVDFCWGSVCFHDTRSGGLSFRRVLDTEDVEPLYAQTAAAGIGFGMTIRTTILHRLGGFRTDRTHTEDTDLIIRLLRGGHRPRIVDAILADIYRHDDGRQTDSSNADRRVAEILEIVADYGDFFDRFPAIRQQLQYHAARLKDSAQVERTDES